MNKHELSERDICTKYILPALERAGWDRMLQLREEFEMSKGRITVRGKVVSRGRPRRADIVLCYKPNIPIAVIEAKSNLRSVGADLQQALEYSEEPKAPSAWLPAAMDSSCAAARPAVNACRVTTQQPRADVRRS